MKTIPVIGTLDDAGEAREYPAGEERMIGRSRVTHPAYVADQEERTARMVRAVKVIGGIGDFLECPACGEMLDKRDLGKLIAHEEECRGRC